MLLAAALLATATLTVVPPDPGHIKPGSLPQAKSVLPKITQLPGGGRYHGDSPECLEGYIQASFDDLRVRPSVRLTLVYSDQVGLVSARRSFVAFWYQQQCNGPVLFELRESDVSNWAERPMRRIVANGSDLAVYDYQDNTYSLTPLDTCSSWTYSLLDSLYPVTDKGGKLIAKLLGQVYGGPCAIYYPWLANACPSGDQGMVSYTVGGGCVPTSILNFSLFPLKGIIGRETGIEPINPRTVSWTLLVEHIPLAPGVGGADFTFAPPKDSKKVPLGAE